MVKLKIITGLNIYVHKHTCCYCVWRDFYGWNSCDSNLSFCGSNLNFCDSNSNSCGSSSCRVCSFYPPLRTVAGLDRPCAFCQSPLLRNCVPFYLPRPLHAPSLTNLCRILHLLLQIKTTGLVLSFVHILKFYVRQLKKR